MPWEENGRRWHTQDRVAHDGNPVNWDGRALAAVIDRIEQHEGFAPTNWNSRSVVEVTGSKPSLGWFLHALTGERWLLKLKFRIRRGTFKQAELQERIKLKTPNEMEELPIYGNRSRVRLSSQAAWQEIEVRVHSLEEIDTPEFWQFLEEAVDGFTERVKRVESESAGDASLGQARSKVALPPQGLSTPVGNGLLEAPVLETIAQVAYRILLPRGSSNRV
jgi:excinuclease ABC subunit A